MRVPRREELNGLNFARRFPAITALCRNAGVDPVTQPIPVRPAAHYHMGGVLVDQAGRTSVDGLWACGEAACTGLHGANRLASNSLLEAAVCGGWVAQDIAGKIAKAQRMTVAAPVASKQSIRLRFDLSCRARPACCVTVKGCAPPQAPFCR